MLNEIKSPEQIKNMSIADLKLLAEEIRQELIQTVSQTGGHLASNLGIVELTIALHYVFNCPEDRFVFDVGHQSYVHKLLTGRYEKFHMLRQENGLCGFPDPAESSADCFASGHASNAISAALGISRAGKNAITILGDGALTGGMCYEALNDAGQSGIPMIVILNDNEMSISKNVGAMSYYLNRLRQNSGYIRVKKNTKNALNRHPKIGFPLYHLMERFRNAMKAFLMDGSFFEALGFNYVGPVDGHDLGKLIQVLKETRNTQQPLLVHVITQKGRGYVPAENAPTSFHGVAPFYIDSGALKSEEKTLSSGQETSRLLTAIAANDPTIRVVCAAMLTGTGMESFKEHHPDRFFDVGIAEEHAITMAAGMASEGLHPYVAIYSTFLQRGYDQIMIDVCRNHLPVTFLIDRAGFVGADGKTHQGLYDIGYLNTIPGMVITSARDVRSLRKLIRFSASYRNPMSIRYSKSCTDLGTSLESKSNIQLGEWEVLAPGKDIMIIAEGAMVSTALRVSMQLAAKGISCGVTDAMFIKPIDTEKLSQFAKTAGIIVTLEEHSTTCGLGSIVARHLVDARYAGRLVILGAPDDYIEHAGISRQRTLCGLDDTTVTKRIIDAISEEKNHEAQKS